jgi:hypothetical protein
MIEDVQDRRETEARHSQTIDKISRVEASIVEVIEREMKAVLAKLHEPNLSTRELEDEMANLNAMRQYGREPFMAEGMLTNSSWYEELRSKPNLFGRVLNDHDAPGNECFYVFLDTDKTRLLEITPFALQQLLAGQAHGVPRAKLIGMQDIFAERTVELTNSESLPASTAPTSHVPSTQGVRFFGTTFPGSILPSDFSRMTERAENGDTSAMATLGWMYATANDPAKSQHWYRKAAELGDPDAMKKLGMSRKASQ